MAAVDHPHLYIQTPVSFYTICVKHTHVILLVCSKKLLPSRLAHVNPLEQRQQIRCTEHTELFRSAYRSLFLQHLQIFLESKLDRTPAYAPLLLLSVHSQPDLITVARDRIPVIMPSARRRGVTDLIGVCNTRADTVPFPVSWTVKMKKKQKETQDILSYHSQAAGCSDKARAKASGGRQPIEECGRTGL